MNLPLQLPIILDGATGTQLQKKGLPMGQNTEQWVLEHPSAIQEVQTAYVENGSDIIYACTFAANRVKMAENDFGTDVADYNHRLVALSKEVAGKALVGGDISPLGKFLPPMGDMPFEEMVSVYAEQAKALEEAGVDLYAVETTITLPEARAAVLGIRSVSDKPIFVTFTCGENGKIMTGTDVTSALVTMQSMGVDAFGLNCSTGPDMMLTQMKRLHEYAQIPLIAKPNAGLPEMIDGVATYNCAPSEFTKYVADFAANGVGIFGGCCGTTEEHIKALKEATLGLSVAAPNPLPTDVFLLATEKELYRIPKDIEISEADILSCEDPDDFEDDLYDEEDKDLAVTAVRITSEEDVEVFAGAQYAIAKPLCIYCEDASLLEQTLRAYQGRAMYRGSIATDLLAALSIKYGVEY